MIPATVAVLASPKVSGPIATWAASNVFVVSQIQINGPEQFAAYIGGVTIPFGAGWFLWRQFLKAQDAADAYKDRRIEDLEAENISLRSTLAGERTELERLRNPPPQETP